VGAFCHTAGRSARPRRAAARLARVFSAVVRGLSLMRPGEAARKDRGAEAILAQHHPLTLRQVFYPLVAQQNHSPQTIRSIRAIFAHGHDNPDRLVRLDI
jgi:hypothetical protein